MMQQHAQKDHAGIHNLVSLACAATLAFGLAACGDDESNVEGQPTLVSATVPAVTDPPSSTMAPSQANAELCELAMEMADMQSFPTAVQLNRYRELAPPEISEAVRTAVPAFLSAGDDAVKSYIAFADDAVEQAIATINAWETDNCGIDHSNEPGAPLTGGATREREDGATVVAIVATDYSFELGNAVMSPGRTSLVLTNDGQEAHYLQLFKLAEGVTMEQVMSSQNGGEGLIDGSWDSGVAAPGGIDEEVLTLDLEPGTYGLACYISTADGTPHAVAGMTAQFTVV